MQRVEAPSIAPAKGGLLSVANVTSDFTGPGLFAGVSYRSTPCGPARAVPREGEGDKTFDEPHTLTGSPFGIYKGVDLSLLDEADISAADILDRGAGYAVEQGVQTALLNKNAVVLRSDGVSPRMALALLEQHAGEVYMGTPTFHLNRFGAVFMPFETEAEDGVLTTRQGSPVANGAGYGPTGPGGAEAADGQFWLYASGQVNLWRSAPILADGYDLPRNRSVALAEQFYIPTVECFVAAVLVNAE